MNLDLEHYVAIGRISLYASFKREFLTIVVKETDIVGTFMCPLCACL